MPTKAQANVLYLINSGNTLMVHKDGWLAWSAHPDWRNPNIRTYYSLLRKGYVCPSSTEHAYCRVCLTEKGKEYANRSTG